MNRATEIYIHLPFCIKKCGYCDFLSFALGREKQREYTDALLKQIRAYGERAKAAGGVLPVSSVFFGGGTPSVLPAEWIGEITDVVREVFAVEPDAEISIESNPGTLTGEKLAAYRSFGINRLSIGCQSMDDGELRRLGRIHTHAEFLQSFRLAREAGFDNINIDLMSALPGQTEESWEKGLRLACELGPEHISAYSLILEEGTPFYNKYKEQETALAADGFCPDGDGAIPPEQRLPDEETERLMYRRTEEILASYGYHRYEISNYAKPGRECRHNLGYWTLVPYIGFGLGASSYEETEGNGGRVRYRNTDDLRAYLAGDFSPCEVEQIEKKDGMAEFVILGLRLMRGVSAAEFRERFGVGIREVYGPVIRKYRENGLLAVNADRMYLTKEGISVSNTIMADFLL